MQIAPSTSIYRLESHDVATLEWGPREGRLIIALHGFPDTAWTWRGVAPIVADAGFRVVAPFMRGYAPSGIPADGDYSVSALAADAVGLADRLGGEAILLGHDWGAIATDVMASRADSPFIKHVALAVPPLPWVNPTRQTLRPWLGAVARQPFHSWYIAYNQIPGAAERTFGRLTAKLWRDWSPSYDGTEDLAFLKEATPTLAHRRAVVSYYRAILSRGSRAAFADPVHPLLSLQGDQDECFDQRFFASVAANVTAGSRAELIPDAGHFLQLEQPELVAARILDFVG